MVEPAVHFVDSNHVQQDELVESLDFAKVALERDFVDHYVPVQVQDVVLEGGSSSQDDHLVDVPGLLAQQQVATVAPEEADLCGPVGLATGIINLLIWYRAVLAYGEDRLAVSSYYK